MLRVVRTLILALCAGALAGVAAAQDRVVLPIVDFVFGAPVIEVRLNGGEAHRFKFDSGSMELIDGGKATAEGIRATGVTKLLEINKAETMPVSDTEVRLGEAELGTVSLALMPDGWAHPAAIDGIIGKTLLLRYVVTMDVVGRQMILSRPEAYTVPDGATVLPMTELHGLFHVPASLDGAAGEFGLDTGLTTHVIVFPAFDQAHGLALRYGDAAIVGDAAGTSGETSKVRQAKGEMLTLGGSSVAGPEVLILTDATGVGRFDQMAGLIGMPALAQFTVTFDAPHKRLVLTPASIAPAPEPPPPAPPPPAPPDEPIF
ncbi:MAG: hypothetical protein E7812_03140 [Phenylobacterium sp.]|nr:MAG: hypothetical protein E7812_03140 [Phenylobacterium sp.]